MTAALRIIPASRTSIDDGAGIGPLPFAMTQLIGRDAHVKEVARQLTAPEIRLLTLTGSGGIGKTRLALAAAHAIRQSFADGAHLLRLASVTDPTLAPVTIARVLDVPGSPDDQYAWASAEDRHCLLVVDNFEQLLAAAPSLVEVLSRCPRVTMLVTSREPLNVSGEHLYLVPPLTTPPEEATTDLAKLGQVDAVRLFVKRAIAVNPDFQLTLDNGGAVSGITRRLDGLPLAIELAAAQCKHLTPRAIADRLAATNDDLRGGPVDRPPHQQAIRDTIAWSYDLLEPREQALFRTLSVFAGGFMPQAAEYVHGAVDNPPDIHLPDVQTGADYALLDRCVALASKNLIFKAEDFQDEPRFSMLLTIRGFAQAELQRRGEVKQVSRRHAAWYLAFVNAAAAAIGESSQTIWLDWLEAEHPNLRTALGFFREHREFAAFARMAHALGRFWLVRGHLVEGLGWIRIAIAEETAASIDHQMRAELLCAAGWLALRQGLAEDARAHAESSWELARTSGDAGRSAAALRLLGDIEDRLANYDRARTLMNESLVAFRDAGDLVGIADTLTGLAGIAMDRGDYDEAALTFKEAVGTAKNAGDANILARAMDSLSLTLHLMGKTGEAIGYAERALELYRTHGNVRGIAIAMDHVGKYSRSLGDPIRAWDCHRESLAWRRKVGDPRGMAVWLEAMAGLLARCNAFDAAACVLGAVGSMRERGGFPLHDGEKAQLLPIVSAIQGRLSADRYARARARGSRLSLTEIVDYAYAEAERAVGAWTPDLDQPAPEPMGETPAVRELTAREREVARLLTLNLSNNEIAEQLSISPRTVSTHVDAILGKLGVHSRREVARYAEQLGRNVSSENESTGPDPSTR